MTRPFTCKILELLDEGYLDRDQLINSLLCWMSESDVKEFYENNYAFDEEDAA